MVSALSSLQLLDLQQRDQALEPISLDPRRARCGGLGDVRRGLEGALLGVACCDRLLLRGRPARAHLHGTGRGPRQRSREDYLDPPLDTTLERDHEFVYNL